MMSMGTENRPPHTARDPDDVTLPVADPRNAVQRAFYACSVVRSEGTNPRDDRLELLRRYGIVPQQNVVPFKACFRWPAQVQHDFD